MHLIYQHDDIITLYHSDGGNLLKRQLTGKLHQAVQQAASLPIRAYTYLLDERWFVFATYHVQSRRRTPRSIRDFKALIAEKIAQWKQEQAITTDYITYQISDIFVNKQPETHILGHTGDVQFTLQLMGVQPDVKMNMLIGAPDRHRQLSEYILYPKSFFIKQYVCQKMQRHTFALCYLWENICHLIVIEKGNYKSVHKVNMWLELLNACYQEHDVQHYFLNQRGAQLPQLAAKLILEANSFFTESLCKWMHQFLSTGSECFLITDASQDALFLQSMQESYRTNINWFLAPLSSLVAPHLFTYQPSELDIAAYALATQSAPEVCDISQTLWQE